MYTHHKVNSVVVYTLSGYQLDVVDGGEHERLDITITTLHSYLARKWPQ